MGKKVPKRRKGALTGSEFVNLVKHDMSNFQERAYKEILKGNIPDFLRPENFQPIIITKKIKGKTVRAIIRVAPDYIAIGSNEDFVRVPLNGPTAQKIAQHFGWLLPTQKLADEIQKKSKMDGGVVAQITAPKVAKYVINPKTGKPVSNRWNLMKYGNYEGKWMMTPDFFDMHDRLVEGDIAKKGIPTYSIRWGHKKDIIYHHRLIGLKHALFIYRRGWQPIQTKDFHGKNYFDYSHGVRFINSEVALMVIGPGKSELKKVSLVDLIKDKELYKLFSNVPMDVSKMYQLPVVHLSSNRRKKKKIQKSF